MKPFTAKFAVSATVKVVVVFAVGFPKYVVPLMLPVPESASVPVFKFVDPVWLSVPLERVNVPAAFLFRLPAPLMGVLMVTESVRLTEREVPLATVILVAADKSPEVSLLPS